MTRRVTSPISGELKWCPHCSTWKMLEEFTCDARLTSGYSSKCLKCNALKSSVVRKNNPNYNDMQTQYRSNHPEQIKIYKRRCYVRAPEKSFEHKLRSVFGMSLAEYECLYAEQGGLCAICGKSETRVNKQYGTPHRLSVDHDHVTGKIRGLLCGGCNPALGGFGDSVEMLQKAIDYLRRSL